MHVCGRFHVSYYCGIPEQIEHYLENDPSFADLSNAGFGERESFRVVICLPADVSAIDDWPALAQDPRLANLADFVVFTDAGKQSEEEEAPTAADIRAAGCPVFQ